MESTSLPPEGGAVPSGPTTQELALERTRLATERTMMAWTRTGTSLISFGFSIYKFADILEKQGQHTGPRLYGSAMILIGLVAVLMATVEHRRSTETLRAQGAKVPWSLATFVAFLVSALGLLALVLVVLNR